MTAYGAEVLADSPVVFYRGGDLNPTITGYVDSSGNNRPLNKFAGQLPNVGSGPSAVTAFPAPGVAGPKKWGMTFSSDPLCLATSYTQTQPTVGTYECWVYFTSNPSTDVTLGGWVPLTGSTGPTFTFALTNAGKISLSSYDGASVTITSPSAISTSAWHHVIASIGAAGTKIRVDKTNLVTGAKTSATGFAGAAYWIHGSYNGSTYANMTGACQMAESAFYSTQLSDARTDAHYDATSESLDLSWGVGG